MKERRDRREYDDRLSLIDSRIKRLERSIYGFMSVFIILNVLWAIPEMEKMFS